MLKKILIVILFLNAGMLLPVVEGYMAAGYVSSAIAAGLVVAVELLFAALMFRGYVDLNDLIIVED